MDLEKIGNMIKKCRLEMGMTQAELAEKVGVSDKTVSKWEKGYTVPKSIVFAKLADALEISVTELFDGERKEKVEPVNHVQKKRYSPLIIAGIFVIIIASLLIYFLIR